MLRYKYIKAIYLTLCITCLVLGLIYELPWMKLLIIMSSVYLLIVVYSSFYVRSNVFLKLYHEGGQDGKCIALTFDDGPSPETHAVLDILKKYQVKATFFVVGKNVKKYPQILKRIVDDGHVIGNHTFRHAATTGFMSSISLQSDFSACIQAVQDVVKLKMNLFRPPFGVTSPNIAKAVSQLHLTPIGWSLRSFDTTIKPAKAIAQTLLKKIKSGDVVLLHDNRIKVQEVLHEILPQLVVQHYQFLTVAELFNVEPYTYEK
jgi:peptidoglycan-N-acetylglucosamine deacetylase